MANKNYRYYNDSSFYTDIYRMDVETEKFEKYCGNGKWVAVPDYEIMGINISTCDYSYAKSIMDETDK